MATIRDVAAEAGVSVGTVSNYLNKKINVREENSAARKAMSWGLFSPISQNRILKR